MVACSSYNLVLREDPSQVSVLKLQLILLISTLAQIGETQRSDLVAFFADWLTSV